MGAARLRDHAGDGHARRLVQAGTKSKPSPKSKPAGPSYRDTIILQFNAYIDTALSAGVGGTLDAARRFYSTWDFNQRSLRAELEDRGVDRVGTLPFYYYRDDALAVYDAIAKYCANILGLWYLDDGDLARDHELGKWTREIAAADGGDLTGFPAVITTRERLYEVATELIFRAGPQHAAVNNGQFDAYGWVPNSPALMTAALPDDPSPEGGYFNETSFWEALPRWSPATSQLNMVWVLSAPTRRSLLHSGESPAFHPSLCPEAEQIVGGFRRRLHSISESIHRRNRTLDIPYRFLDPMSVSRSTSI